MTRTDRHAPALLRRGAAAACAAVLVASLAACPSQPSDSASGTPTPSSSLELVNTPWRLMSQDGATLTLRVSDGGCFAFQRLDVREDQQQVTIASKSSMSVGEPCTTDLRQHDERVTLQSPLGNRTLTPAPISSSWRGPS